MRFYDLDKLLSVDMRKLALLDRDRLFSLSVAYFSNHKKDSIRKCASRERYAIFFVELCLFLFVNLMVMICFGRSRPGFSQHLCLP